MKLSRCVQEERAFIEAYLGDSVICGKCSATLKTFADACTAGLQDQCPGYLAIERAKAYFAMGRSTGRAIPIPGPFGEGSGP